MKYLILAAALFTGGLMADKCTLIVPKAESPISAANQ
jgi:hypothetical protein